MCWKVPNKPWVDGCVGNPAEDLIYPHHCNCSEAEVAAWHDLSLPLSSWWLIPTRRTHSQCSWFISTHILIIDPCLLHLLTVYYSDLCMIYTEEVPKWHLSGFGLHCQPCRMMQEQWLALESRYKASQTRAIGVANFCAPCLKCIMKVATVTPHLNQFKLHAGMPGSLTLRISNPRIAPHILTISLFFLNSNGCQMYPLLLWVDGVVVYPLWLWVYECIGFSAINTAWLCECLVCIWFSIYSHACTQLDCACREWSRGAHQLHRITGDHYDGISGPW